MKRALDNPEYEPPVRDPKAIRNTVLILIAVILVGGILIVWKYLEKMGEELAETKKGRPAMSLGNVRKNFQTKGLDGNVYDFTILEDKFSLITVISQKLPEQSRILIDELKLAAKHFSGEKRIQVVCISADPTDQVSLDQLRDFVRALGVPESWHVLSAGNKEFVGYLKDGLKLGLVTKKGKETGERELPDLVRMVDPTLKIRGEIDDFKFIYYKDVERRAKLDLANNSELKENPEVQKEMNRYLNASSINRDKMYKNIQYMIDNETYDVAFSKKNNSNRYNVPLIVFGGFVLFIIVMGLRVKKQRA